MKTDLKKQLASYTAPHDDFQLTSVPPLQYLMIDGHGDPNTSPAYAAALAALFSVAYKLKFLSRRELDRDYTVMPLEALWWADDMESFTTARDKSHWDWTVMSLVPDWITLDHLAEVRDAIVRAGGASAIEHLRLETLDEGDVVQTLHIGSYDDEGPVLQRMHDEFIPAHALTRVGKHHEIYLNDFRRTPPEKLRTILRQPVATASDRDEPLSRAGGS